MGRHPLFSKAQQTALLGGIRKGEINPLYHSCYHHENAPMMGPAAVMMKNRLAAVGLTLGSHIPEPPDHIAIELEYLFYLLTNGFADENTSQGKAASSFAADDMLPWVLKLQQRLSDRPDAAFYTGVVAVTIGILRLLAHPRFSWPGGY